MSQLPCYESYKNSGVQWLGEIPSHWEVKRMKFLLSEKLKYGANESAESEDKDQPRYIRITDINDSGTLREDTFKSLEIEKAQEYLLNDLDILLARSGATVGKSYLHKKDKVNVACYAGYLIRARFNKENYDPQFINLFLQSKAYWSWIESVNIQATIQNVSAEKYNDLALSIPSLAEQKIIADFLDKRLAQVDALIAKQETLLEKLAEQRVALISHAVTKGLNPDVEMKESDVVLLGNIPNTWNVKRLKFLLSEKLKYGANESAESEDKENPRYIRITDIDDSGNLKDETFKSLESEKAQEYLLDDLDILLARSGATVGKSYLYKAESVGIACYAGYLIRARLDQENYNPEFVNYFLQSKQYWDWISSINIQATIQNVSAEKYNDLTLAIPSLEEQKQLIEYLKNEDEKFNRAIGKGKKLVHLLNEYRSTLITQVVTGKIDVQNLKVN